MPTSTADASVASTLGFTETDLADLNVLGASALQQRQWSRAQVVHGPSSDYLAAWVAGTGPSEAPHLAIARFKRTGTYVLTVGTQVVLTAPSLTTILETTRQLLTGDRCQATFA